ncbi:MAG: hypothetical protein U9Q66_01835 [Patescibacteria group bacterium]|nr:hypothetical protein [Patescibacteria group bacterium]
MIVTCNKRFIKKDEEESLDYSYESDISSETLYEKNDSFSWELKENNQVKKNAVFLGITT